MCVAVCQNTHCLIVLFKLNCFSLLVFNYVSWPVHMQESDDEVGGGTTCTLSVSVCVWVCVCVCVWVCVGVCVCVWACMRGTVLHVKGTKAGSWRLFVAIIIMATNSLPYCQLKLSAIAVHVYGFCLNIDFFEAINSCPHTAWAYRGPPGHPGPPTGQLRVPGPKSTVEMESGQRTVQRHVPTLRLSLLQSRVSYSYKP